MNNKKTVRYTATLTEETFEELKFLVKEKQVPSINYAIKKAIDDYLEQTKKLEYDKLMSEAGKDKDFLMRTIQCSEDFNEIDNEVAGEW
ncbi:hypothetical protein [Sedimentibacter sp.]|uniref:hypothetical protein n=1 Tax=Sedimentibacter sp. TaxID=1960295 RepID=UPI0028A0D38B|nr:hypothetical protein [Sedimentibacter sp.]